MLSLLKLALATYRLSRLIAVDEGPVGVFFRARHALGAYDYGENGEPATVLGRGISCPHCVGVYVAVALWLMRGSVVVDLFAVMGLQSFLWSLRGD